MTVSLPWWPSSSSLSSPPSLRWVPLAAVTFHSTPVIAGQPLCETLPVFPPPGVLRPLPPWHCSPALFGAQTLSLYSCGVSCAAATAGADSEAATRAMVSRRVRDMRASLVNRAPPKDQVWLQAEQWSPWRQVFMERIAPRERYADVRASHQVGADPVVAARAARPQPCGEAVLLGLGALVGVRRGTAQALPGRVEDLVIARGARGVRGRVLAAGLALHDRPRDRPRAARAARGGGAGAGGEQPGERLLRAAAPGAGAREGRHPGRVGLGERVAALAQAGGDAGQRVAACADRERLALLGSGQPRELDLLAAGVRAGVAHEVQHVRVGAFHPLDEGQRVQQLR